MGLRLRFGGAVLLGASLSSGGLHAEVIHVPGDEPTIQAGIDAAVDGDEVVVADGLYTGPGNRAVSTGTKLITVRSAGGPGACVIDCEFQERGFFVGGAAVVQGFTIRNGQAEVCRAQHLQPQGRDQGADLYHLARIMGGDDQRPAGEPPRHHPHSVDGAGRPNAAR